jgi:signal transduction histidine kinase
VTAGRRPGRLPAVRGTLRLKVTAVSALAVLVVLALGSLGLVLAQRHALVESMDELLDQHADALEVRARSERPLQPSDLPSDDVVAQVVAADGRVLAASPDLEEALPGGAEDFGPATVRLPGADEETRLLVRAVDGTTIRMAGSLDDVQDSTASLAGTLVLAVPLSTAVLAAVLWWAVGRALRPVEAIRARVDRITGSDLDQRVPEPATAAEIARLASTMNAMLARLQESAERQRRFVADASHELRSPLARMRTELEVDRAHPGSADPAGTAASVLAETVGLQRLVDDLLLLARGDADALPQGDRRPVDLDDLVERSIRQVRGDGAVRIDARGVRPAQVAGDGAHLQRAVVNLLENAVRHARGEVVVTVAETGDGAAEVVVHDDGPGVPPEDRERVFERFTRLDDSRTASTGGAGLGLAIARDIAERHGGTLTLAEGGSAGARFVLRLPVVQAHRNGRITGSGPG